MPYATAEQLKLADSLGYTHEMDRNRGSRFHNGVRNVWGIYGGWQTANLQGGRYECHTKFPQLEDALQRPI
jgi:hypothetical protein